MPDELIDTRETKQQAVEMMHRLAAYIRHTGRAEWLGVYTSANKVRGQWVWGVYLRKRS